MILSLVRLFSLFLSSGGASDSADEEQVRVNSTRYGNRHESRLSKNQSDYVNDPHPSDGMKSKSPVSLEIRLPSTTGKMTLYSVLSSNFMNHDANTGHLVRHDICESALALEYPCWQCNLALMMFVV